MKLLGAISAKGRYLVVVVAFLLVSAISIPAAFGHGDPGYCGHSGSIDGGGWTSAYEHGWGSGLSHMHHYHHYLNGYYSHGIDRTCPEPWEE